MALLKENRPDHDFFMADIFDNTPVKDDMASMEHPIFVLSKKKDMRCLEYKRNDVTISIIPSALGLPTIFDKDILLYCTSLLMREINAGRTPPKTFRVSTHDILVSTNRTKDGRSYERLKAALDRLTGVLIKTNIKTNKREVTKAFGVLESYEIVESSKVKNRMVKLEITMSDWFYNSVLGNEVLTISRDYFRLGKPMERRLYEIARKHCGQQQSWSISLVTLMEKVGSTGTFRLFRSRIKTIVNDNHLPDYNIALDDDTVTFSQKKQVEEQAQLSFDTLPMLSHSTIEKARNMVVNSGCRLDFYNIHSEFSESLAKGFAPDNVDGAFIGFVKKKISETF